MAFQFGDQRGDVAGIGDQDVLATLFHPGQGVRRQRENVIQRQCRQRDGIVLRAAELVQPGR